MAATGRVYIIECFSGNLVKDRIFCLLIIPCIFDEGRLVDKETLCFLLNLVEKTRRNLVDKAKYSLLHA